MNYKKDKSYIKQRLEYVNSVDYISELEEQIENLQIEKEDYKSRCEKAIEYIKSTNFYGVRSGKTLFSKNMNDLLKILGGNQ